MKLDLQRYPSKFSYAPSLISLLYRFNPLKVLHNLIEPSFPKEQLDIAVVGISNWALDAAKMNRAIHLSRPDPGRNFKY